MGVLTIPYRQNVEKIKTTSTAYYFIEGIKKNLKTCTKTKSE